MPEIIATAEDAEKWRELIEKVRNMMKQKERKITPEQYQRAVMLNGSYLTKIDELEVFSDAERIGYGASSVRVFEREGEFYVNYMISDYCD